MNFDEIWVEEEIKNNVSTYIGNLDWQDEDRFCNVAKLCNYKITSGGKSSATFSRYLGQHVKR